MYAYFFSHRPVPENVDREEWQRILDMYGQDPSQDGGDQRLREILEHLDGVSGQQQQQDGSVHSGDEDM